MFIRNLLRISPVIILLFQLIVPVIALAQPAGDFGLYNTAKQAGLSVSATDPIKVVGDIINYLLGFLGVVFLVLILYAGFLWMTASGNEEQITKAKKLLGHSVIGLIIILVAYTIAVLIFSQLATAIGVSI